MKTAKTRHPRSSDRHLPSIDEFMTAAPETIGKEQTLATARRIMREKGIRHLPVLEGGDLVGVVSMNDLHLIETMKDVDINRVSVAEAMHENVYAVSCRTGIESVAREMARMKYGSAVVLEEGQVVGIFTVVDALSALAWILDREADEPETRRHE
jgi:acetoin utilization protein AcuB